MLRADSPSPCQTGICQAGRTAVQIHDQVESSQKQLRSCSELSFGNQRLIEIRITRETVGETLFDKDGYFEGRKLFFYRPDR